MRGPADTGKPTEANCNGVLPYLALHSSELPVSDNKKDIKKWSFDSSDEGSTLALAAAHRQRVVPEHHRESMIIEALRLAGHQPIDSEINYARAMVKQESTFNAGAVNRTDINARHKRPSKGWAQVIDSTFRSFHVPGHNDIWNPVDNLAAAIRYADYKYGQHDIQGNGLRWVSEHRSKRHKGY